jgi:AI-2 transport protein TqsA
MTNEPVDGPPADTSEGAEAIEAIGTTPRQPAFLRMLLVLAATAVVLVGMRLAAPVLNPILFAVVLSLLFGPIYAWLKRRGIPTPLALVIMLVGLALLFSVIFYVLSAGRRMVLTQL